MISFLLWVLLFVICWPLAILALMLWPIVWLISLPFRLLGIAVEGVFELLRAVIMLPARVLGGGGSLRPTKKGDARSMRPSFKAD